LEVFSDATFQSTVFACSTTENTQIIKEKLLW